MYVAYELRSTCEEKAELQFQPAKFHRVLEIKLNSSIKKKNSHQKEHTAFIPR